MSCCQPQQLLLSLHKPQLDFNNTELYHQHITTLLQSHSKIYAFDKLNSLEIENNMNHHFKSHHDHKSQFLFEICDAQQQLTMNYVMKNNEKDVVWRILTDKESHLLNVSDKIKIGLTEFYVYSKKEQWRLQAVEEESKTNYCRYCHSNAFSSGDPMVNLCDCKGSMEFMHVECLRSWIMMKAELDYKDSQIFYMFRELKCQICKKEWPKQYFYAGIYHPLLSFETSEAEEEQFQFDRDAPYLVIQTNSLDEQDIQIIIFIKINLSQKFTIGDQSQEVNLILDGFGVSPQHCTIQLINDEIFITDNGSKMGTLVTLHKEELFTTKKSIVMQYGNIIWEIKIDDGSFLSCFWPEMEYNLKFKIMSHKSQIKK